MRKVLPFIVTASLVGTLANADNKSPNWLLRSITPMNTSELRVELEQCVSSLDFVSTLSVTPAPSGPVVEMEVVNNSEIPISGLVVQSNDEYALELGLDGQSIVEFGYLGPGESVTHSENVPKIRGFFDEKTVISMVAVDVIDLAGNEVLANLFEGRWFSVSSEEELEHVTATFCSVMPN